MWEIEKNEVRPCSTEMMDTHPQGPSLELQERNNQEEQPDNDATNRNEPSDRT